MYNQAIKYATFGCRTAYSLREQSAVYGRRYVAVLIGSKFHD